MTLASDAELDTEEAIPVCGLAAKPRKNVPESATHEHGRRRALLPAAWSRVGSRQAAKPHAGRSRVNRPDGIPTRGSDHLFRDLPTCRTRCRLVTSPFGGSANARLAAERLW